MKNPLYNATERRARAWLRILIYGGLVFMLVQLGLAIIGSVLLLQIVNDPAQFSQEDLGQLLQTILVPGWYALISTVVAVGLLPVFSRYIDRRSFDDYGLWLPQLTWWRDLLFGAGLGAALMVLIFLVEWSLGWVQVTGTFVSTGGAFASGLVVWLLAFTGIAIWEEVAFRGYLMLNLAEGLNVPVIGTRGAVWLAWMISSVVFGLLHGLNPNATLISNINLSIAGLFLGLGYLLTRSLAIPIGLHLTWNFFQGVVFGFPVSGLDRDVTVVAIEQGGPTMWTGGAFGPEAGLIGLVAIALGMVLTVGYVRLVYGRASVQTELAEYEPRPNATPQIVTNAQPTG